jgi:hypothetical protein
MLHQMDFVETLLLALHFLGLLFLVHLVLGLRLPLGLGILVTHGFGDSSYRLTFTVWRRREIANGWI